MPSDNALNLVNKVLVATGDYAKLTTVVNSPADIAERIINFANITLADIGRNVDMPIVRDVFTATGDGTNSIWESTQANSAAFNINYVVVGQSRLRELTVAQLAEARATRSMVGLPQVFARRATGSGTMSIDVFPTPSAGTNIEVVSYKTPAQFTLSDTSTTEMNNIDDLLVLGCLMHMDAYDGMQRGYAALYEKAKLKLMQDTYKTTQIRIQPESYT